MAILCPDLMHTIAGELRRIFTMVLGARISQSIAQLEADLGKYVHVLDQTFDILSSLDVDIIN